MANKATIGQAAEAVVLGGTLNGLGVVRSLARAGIPVTVVGTRFTGAALWSRHASPRLVREYIGEDFTADMIKLGRTFSQRPVLFLTDEECVRSVSENRNDLADWFIFRLPSKQCIDTASDKGSFHEFAWKHGFPVPCSIILETEQDVDKLETMSFPCIIKPDDKRQVLRGNAIRVVKAESLHEARMHAISMLNAGIGIVAQEWIEGADSNIYFTLFYRGSEGCRVAAFTGRKLLSFPRHVGSTAICVAADEARDVLEPMTLRFAECAGLDGMGSMEYKWDDRHKRFTMIEPTVGRTDWQEEIATLCGINIPAAAYRHELGLSPMSEARHGANMAWRATFIDRVPRHFRTLGSVLIDGYFRWDDPLPALQHYCVVNPLRHVLRKWKIAK
ncbi:ATP-grasp enzyme-like protein [Caballeronia fortuita]|uniref:ATP-grasp enzyme-like protein n=1 Tax=Caballeronia fortuita TaxID=1777138 RepID=A0A158E0J3_9BURK|nr:carboxylate--amine ligase [Caballeronia fortuita]SAL00425.1 ATP-grasp enzyme-like protein [Caballeronia fortuita]